MTVTGDLAHGATLPVSEVYGPVFQGEGPHAGRRVHFLRLGLCNLRCSWCDTPYTWDTSRFNVAQECPPMTWEAIAERIPDAITPLVLTGGEPLIHQHTAALRALLDTIPNPVHVETNGTTVPLTWMRERVAWWSVSPKLHHQGDPEKRRVRPTALREFASLSWQHLAGLKVVCRDPDDVAYAIRVATEHGFDVRDVWIMPEGVSRETVLELAAELEPVVLQYGANLTLRQHVLLHGSERLR